MYRVETSGLKSNGIWVTAIDRHYNITYRLNGKHCLSTIPLLKSCAVSFNRPVVKILDFESTKLGSTPGGGNDKKFKIERIFDKNKCNEV